MQIVLILRDGKFCLPGVAEDLPPRLRVDLRQSADGDFGPVHADVERLEALLGVEQGLQVARDRVADVAEGTGGTAVRVHDDIPVLPHRVGEICRNPRVIEPHTGAIVVEGADDGDGCLILLVEQVAHGLPEPLCLVIAGPGALAVHVPPVGLRGGDVLRRGIAVDFAGGVEGQAANGLLAVEVQQPAQAPDVGVQGLNGILPVEDRGGDGRHVIDVVRVRRAGDTGDIVRDDVEPVQLHPPLIAERLEPCRAAHLEVVQTDDLFYAQLLLETGEKGDEIEAQEPCPAGEQDGAVLKPGALRLVKAAVDALHVLLYNLFHAHYLHTFQGACPPAQSFSSCSFSRTVSMHCQKPVCL